MFLLFKETAWAESKLSMSSSSPNWKTHHQTVQYLFFTLILCDQVERDGVECAGHDAKHAAEDERCNDVGKEAN